MTAAPAAGLFLGLDVGTQGTKGVVVDGAAGRVVARAAHGYGLLPDLPPGAAEQHPDTWWDAVVTVVGALCAQDAVDPARLAGIGVSGQQHGFVPLDADGAVLRPAKLWCDTTTAAEARTLAERFGRAVPTGFTASKILWLERHEPATFAKLAAVLLPHDYINFRLTGALFTEAGDASGSGLFDPHTRQFRVEDAAAIHPSLPDCLLPVVAPDAPAAALSSTAAQALGLPAGTPVAPGGGDNMMAAIGAGAVQPGVCVLSLGTSGTVFAYGDHPVVDAAGLIAPFCDSTGGWLPLLCTMNVTGVTEEVHHGFDGAGDLDALTAAAAAVEPGCGGVLFIPYLQGERVPDLPAATGALLGLRPGSLRADRLFRAALEGTSLNLGWGVARLRALGIAADEVRVVGGGARNPLWRRILAAVLDAPVQALAEPEAAALGAALQAAWVVRRAAGESIALPALVAPYAGAAGEPVTADPDEVACYAELAARFRQAVERLYD